MRDPPRADLSVFYVCLLDDRLSSRGALSYTTVFRLCRWHRRVVVLAAFPCRQWSGQLTTNLPHFGPRRAAVEAYCSVLADYRPLTAVGVIAW